MLLSFIGHRFAISCSLPGRRAAPFGSPAFRDRTEAGVALGAALREVLGVYLTGDQERSVPSAGPAMTPRLPRGPRIGEPSVGEPSVGKPSVGKPSVLALPRGGVPVAVGVARALGATLDVLVVRKIGHPDVPELGLGAIAEDGAGGAAEPFFDQRLLDEVNLTRDDLAGVVARERAELARRGAVYRRGRDGGGGGAGTDLAGQLVVVVDDGLATGVTARAALRAVRARGAAVVVLAVPVGSPSAVAAVRGDASAAAAARTGAVPGDQAAAKMARGDSVEHAIVPDAPGSGAWHNETGEVVTLVTPRRFRSVGEWYADFGQLTDADVLALLSGA